MQRPYAEVIGDPIAHSKSPLIHNFWLKKLGVEAEYRRTQITPSQLPGYLQDRRRDPCWRGCNVTAPLKKQAAGLVGAPAGLCDFLGAVNCIVRTPLSCIVATNTDLNGIGEALEGANPAVSNILLLGTGGAARAALCYLVQHGARDITIAARNPSRGEALRKMAPEREIHIVPIGEASSAVPAAGIFINATPLGMSGYDPMPLEIVAKLSSGQFVFDMVYAPFDTELLRSARAAGAHTADGLTMLIGQAAPAFELFFGMPAPREHDAELRRLLIA